MTTLQAALASTAVDNPYPDMVTSILLDMLSSDHSKLLSGLHSRSLYSTPLLGQLASFYSNPARDGRKFQDLLQRLSSAGLPPDTVFGKVVHAYLDAFGLVMLSSSGNIATTGPFRVTEFIDEGGLPRNKHHYDASAAEWGRSVVANLKASSSVSSAHFTCDSLRAMLVLVGTHSHFLLEEFLGTFASKFMADKDLACKRPELAKALLDAMTLLSVSNSGPMVDLIEIMLPDMDTNQLLQLVFARKPDSTSHVFYDDYMPHLMSILLHEASWSNLQHFISWMLQKDRALQVFFFFFFSFHYYI